VQFRLLQFRVQAAPPLKDTGNDLIAVRGMSMRSISVRSTIEKTFIKPPSKRIYQILAVVAFAVKDKQVSVDASQVFLVPHAAVEQITNRVAMLKDLGDTPRADLSLILSLLVFLPRIFFAMLLLNQDDHRL
jgi:hypothetical protein